jgi:Tfp pilus assembly protein PilF
LPILISGCGKGNMLASGMLRMESRCFRQTLLIGFLLAAMTLILYWPVQSFDFVYDDELYITDNRPVHDGLSMEGVTWSFTTFHAGNWHPLSWISHMTDFEAYQLNAGGHHRTSALIHAASTVLLFLVLSSMTGAPWCSALAAALFAVHPLHVESVAWVAERKDVLSGFFWILTMSAYACYVKRPTIRRYLLVLLSFVLGLLSKPMLVTLPFVLLLLDYWPFRRFTDAKTAFDRWSGQDKTSGRPGAMRLVVEKLPLFLMAAVSSVVTLVAQREVGAVWSIEKMPIAVRIANAAVSYLEYIRKMLWPVDLAVLYPHEGLLPAWKIVIAFLFLVSISCLVVRKAREFPFLLVGWLWYLGTLVPVIGIIQVGSQSMADRYTYIPLVGLFIAISWGMKSIAERQPKWKHAIIVFILIALSGLLVLARAQVGTWTNSLTLFGHALRVTEVNPVAHHNIGAFYLDQNDCQKAVPHFLKAIEMKEIYADPYHGLGICASRETPPADALYFFTKALEIDPRLTRALIDRGVFSMKQGKLDEAVEDFRQALRIDPAHEGALTNLGMLNILQGKPVEAVPHLIEALRINPHSAQAHNNLGIALMNLGRIDEAVDHFRQAHVLAPQDRAIEENMRQVLTHTAK